jgi:hypothetical protein
MHAWCACRLAVAQTNAAVSHWAARSCHRVLSHWSFYAQQARQLGVQLPSSPSSCSEAEQGQQQQQQQQAAFAGRNRGDSFNAAVGYAGRDDGRSSFAAGQLSRSWSSKSTALKQQLQAAQRSKSLSLSVELPCSQQQQQQQQDSFADAQPATSPAAAAAAALEAAISALSPKPGSQQGSLRSLSAKLSPVLSRTSTQIQRRQSAARAADSGSSSDSEVSALLGPAGGGGNRLSASDAAVAAAWADVAGGKRTSGKPSRHSSRSMALEAEAAALAAMSPRISQQHSPRLSSWGTTEAANTPVAAAAAAPSSTRISWQQQASSSMQAAVPGVEDAAALLRRASRQSAANSPRSAAWFDQGTAGTPQRSMQQQQSPAGRSSSRYLSLSTGSLKDTLSRQHSLSLGNTKPPAAAGAGTAAGGSLMPSVVLVEVQMSFLGVARAQKLRRRWLLVKAWNRWQQLLQVSNCCNKPRLADLVGCVFRQRRESPIVLALCWWVHPMLV